MIPLARAAQPAAIAILRQATALYPKRLKTSDGLLPSKAHINQNPNSDHNSGFACDLSHDPGAKLDCYIIYELFKKDPRVKYLIFSGRIWSSEKGERKYEGSNGHYKHLHISIKETAGTDTSSWFPWLGDAKKLNKVKAVLKPNPKKKETK